MTLAPGEKLGEFEIAGSHGAGGMGEVYRARDTKLGARSRPKSFAKSPPKTRERLARFEREAKFLASLNHPAIATLHGFEDGFLAMELGEGETLPEPTPQEIRKLTDRNLRRWTSARRAISWAAECVYG